MANILNAAFVANMNKIFLKIYITTEVFPGDNPLVLTARFQTRSLEDTSYTGLPNGFYYEAPRWICMSDTDANQCLVGDSNCFTRCRTTLMYLNQYVLDTYLKVLMLNIERRR